MIIKKIAVGNRKEAFIEKELKDSINIISSDDNNKGKTIVIQSLMYCLGNLPAFPSTFNFRRYYYLVEFSHEGKEFTICRKNDTFIIVDGTTFMIFDSISEMKRYWSKKIFQLPNIIKNEENRIVDPELFVQLFFIGQDKKDTSNIANKGYYSKTDFYNMLFSLMGLGATGLSPEEISLAKKRIQELGEEKKTLLAQNKILKSKKTSTSYLSQYNDKMKLFDKIQDIEKIKDKITSLRVLRTTAINRKLKYKGTIKELNSLNRTISTGELRCLDCDSNHIGYATKPDSTYAFDVSTPEIRKEILNSIEEKIHAYEEDIERYTIEINSCQEQLKEMLSEEDISLESIVLYKQDILDASDIEFRLNEIDKEITELIDAIKANQENTNIQIEMQKLRMSSLIKEMNNAYERIDKNGTLVFESLFTKQYEVISGSEETEFHLLKLYAIAKILKHSFPIVVDSFRAEDLSTKRENAIINLFSELGTQVILTTTLKKQEIGKYDNIKYVNHIDYSPHAPSKLLNKSDVKEFMLMIEKLSISM